jgi:hypothetical protein
MLPRRGGFTPEGSTQRQWHQVNLFLVGHLGNKGRMRGEDSGPEHRKKLADIFKEYSLFKIKNESGSQEITSPPD